MALNAGLAGAHVHRLARALGLASTSANDQPVTPQADL
eukprot:CAMPEP_0174386106 /NCGR_PEP_ID=MMETSP0811_2-20130205/127055_1 /TAXON_ID=73025 ORGANISM="Eutreptiella gymnastica-like, Strain CCMP1594" /NCGR_SAMPLE_ID=MMETSP0811_2 /ASSEMBLY_ACC=CAM_ASM_000667 /LENGTH=37 /DNA_ID= /DNA_START= /DNA_END= /DNA_ORIENTATION=